MGPPSDETHSLLSLRSLAWLLEHDMTPEVAITSTSNDILHDHLLRHYRRGELQEDLCFALWRPSTGKNRLTALIDHVELPREGERSLHGNASFSPHYLGRVAALACREGMGLAFLHSHPGLGWQGMSEPDVRAERDVIAYPAMATGLPLVGLTAGGDGYWSARFWDRSGGQMVRTNCPKVRVIGGQRLDLFFDDERCPPPRRRRRQMRTFDTWGASVQNAIARLHVGIIGLGSVGCVVAEAMARIGVTRLTLIDPDRVEEHNLDRLLFGSSEDIGNYKVEVAKRSVQRSTTARDVSVIGLPLSVHNEEAYKFALDCDVIFSCVDRPVPRDVLNFVATAHLIPVIDGGVAIETHANTNKFFSGHWRAHIISPYHRCMRCNGQYNTSMVVMDLDGSLDDPSYVRNLPVDERRGNQNVFPFSLSAASMEVNLMLRFLLAEDWWPPVQQQDYQFVLGETSINNDRCFPHCPFLERRAKGDEEKIFYLESSGAELSKWGTHDKIWSRLKRVVRKIWWKQ